MARNTGLPRPDLVRLRRAAGLTQEALAAAVGLKSARGVKAWESGEHAPAVHHLPAMAAALGVPVAVVVAAILGSDAEPHLKSAQAARIPDPDTIRAIGYHLDALQRLVRQLGEQSDAHDRSQS